MAEVRESTRPPTEADDECSPSASLASDDEKTIPFLRRLTDMLRENEEVISFYPGERHSSKKLLGRIVVHDRAKVESEVLPKYFNHASFASLRRQLNYFAFIRLGKGRQRGATYCNESVVDLDDILRLKRRAVGKTSSPPQRLGGTITLSVVGCPEASDKNAHGKKSSHPEIISIETSRGKKDDHGTSKDIGSLKRKQFHYERTNKLNKKRIHQPLNSLTGSQAVLFQSKKSSPSHVTLDLTTQSNAMYCTSPLGHAHYISDWSPSTNKIGIERLDKDEEILAGCTALLALSYMEAGSPQRLTI